VSVCKVCVFLYIFIAILGFHIANILKTSRQGKRSPHLRYKVLFSSWDILYFLLPFYVREGWWVSCCLLCVWMTHSSQTTFELIGRFLCLHIVSLCLWSSCFLTRIRWRGSSSDCDAVGIIIWSCLFLHSVKGEERLTVPTQEGQQSCFAVPVLHI
jgi:hypothetical protein